MTDDDIIITIDEKEPENIIYIDKIEQCTDCCDVCEIPVGVFRDVYQLIDDPTMIKILATSSRQTYDLHQTTGIIKINIDCGYWRRNVKKLYKIFKHCPILKHIDLNCFQVSDGYLIKLADRCPLLEHLSLSLDGGILEKKKKFITDVGLGNLLHTCKNLKYLDIFGREHVTDKIVPYLVAATNLEYLDLSATRLDLELFELPQLTSLYIYYYDISIIYIIVVMTARWKMVYVLSIAQILYSNAKIILDMLF